MGSTLFTVKLVQTNLKKIKNLIMVYMQKMTVLKTLTVVYLLIVTKYIYQGVSKENVVNN